MANKPDYAHKQTEKELEALERRISAEYGKAAKELQGKIDDYFAKFEKRDADMKSKLDAGEITEDYYKQWRLAQIGRGERFEVLRDRIAERMTKANETAAAYINDETPGLYALNRNYAAYTIEQQAGADVGFDLWDEQTVKRLIKEQPDLMPYYPPERAVKRGIDLAWGKQQITAQVTSGILQGESIKHLSDRLQKNIPDMNRTSAIRAARTAVTGAQNAGRMDSYVAAQKMGIDLERQWVATLDGRTRHEHAKMDGQKAPIGKPFVMGGYKIMYPGDMSAPGYLVYNCRCTLIAAVDGVDTSDAKRRARDPETGEAKLIEDMTYSEWAEKTGKNTAEKVNQVQIISKENAEGKPVEIEQEEIPGIWQARYNEGRKLREIYEDYGYDAAVREASRENYDLVSGLFEDIEACGEKAQFHRSQFFKCGFYGEKPEWVSAVRYGEIPDALRSKNWATDELEQGVSVVAIVRKESDYNMQSIYDVTLGMQGIKKYEVRGWYLGGHGADGEPLLINPRIERELP